MYIIIVKNIFIFILCYCRLVWIISIGFINLLFELLLKYLFGVDDYFVYL